LSSKYEVGIDIGGTFTDVVILDPGSGHLAVGKRLTSSHNPAQAVINVMGEPVTVGNHDSTDLINMVNYWIGQGVTDPVLTLYQFHYYSSFPDSNNPLINTAGSLNLGAIPILVGEVGTTDITNRLDLLRQNGYLGGLFWQDSQPDMGENRIGATQLQAIMDWFYGVISTSDYLYTKYSPSLRIESARTVDGNADAFGNVYYHYIDEAFYDNGTPGNPDDDYGRVDIQVLKTADPGGIIAYRYQYFTGANRTHDAFYESTENFVKLAGQELVSSEMECSAVFLVAKLRGLRAGAILVVNTPEPPEEVLKNPEMVYKLIDMAKVKRGVDNAIKIALETVKSLNETAL